MTAVVNPTTFTINDPTFSSDAITGMTINVGTVTGGPYPQSFAVPAADISAESGGNVTGPLSGLTGWPTANGTYFAVGTATNAKGTVTSAEASFQIEAAPGPIALSFA